MNRFLYKKIICCVVLLVTVMTTFVAYAQEAELTAVEWVEKGDEFRANKNFDKAILAYGQAIQLNPQLENAYAQRGKAFFFTRQYDLAIDDFRKTIEFEPQNGDLYWLCGLAYAGKGQHQLAIDEYNKTLRINKKMYMAYWNSALSYERLGGNYLALQSYQNFLKYAPSQNSDIEFAKKRVEELQAMDKVKIAATDKSFSTIANGTVKTYIFDFLEKDYLTLKVDKPGWKVGFQKTFSNGVTTEFVSGAETVENWTELLTIQFLGEQRNITSQQYGAFVEDNIRRRYGDKVEVHILRASKLDTIIEYRVVGQPGVEDEHTIIRIIRGNVSFGLAMYAAKPFMTPEKRAMGLSIIEDVKYLDHFPAK